MPIQANIVNGAYSGLALLLDAHVPDAPNGCGVIFISGSGWCVHLLVRSTRCSSARIDSKYSSTLP